MRQKLTLSFFLAAALSLTAAAEGRKVPGSADGVRPLLIGATVPEVVVQAADGQPYDLGKAFAEKPTILIFYRGGW